MRKPHGIIVFGANGSGKTTLGRELAHILDFKHIDHEDYAFEKSEIPYTAERPADKCVELMLADIKKGHGFVLSAVTGDFGKEIESLYDLAVYIEAPLELRVECVKQRNIDRFGDLIREGGDMYKQQKKFVDFVTTRPLTRIEQYAETLTCPSIHIDGTTDYKQTAADIAIRFYTKLGEPWRVYTASLGELKIYRFTVIFARYSGKWLYSRHKERDTYETAGDHIEPGETPLNCAKRELYEETGAVKFSIFPAFDYAVHTETEFSYGQVFLAHVHELGDMPNFEMVEVKLFDAIPDKMRFPQILPVLYEKMQAWLNLQSAKDELWDVYDSERNPTGRLHRRADPLPVGEYHLVVHVWLLNSEGEFLITKRAPNKGYPNMWECTGGSAVSGDDSITAAIREVKEETGLEAKPENGKCFFTITREDSICDVWLFRQDFNIGDVILQENETTDAKYAPADEIHRMISNGEFIAFHYIEELFGKAGLL